MRRSGGPRGRQVLLHELHSDRTLGEALNDSGEVIADLVAYSILEWWQNARIGILHYLGGLLVIQVMFRAERSAILSPTQLWIAMHVFLPMRQPWILLRTQNSHRTVTKNPKRKPRRGNQWIKPISTDATAIKTGGSRGSSATHTSERCGPGMERDLRLVSVPNGSSLMSCIIWTISPLVG